MRLVAIVLVLIGAIALGFRGFESQIGTSEQPGRGFLQAMSDPWRRIPPIISGITLVIGLLLLASSSRRQES